MHAEAAHQLLDAALHSRAARHALAEIWNRYNPPDALAYGPRRLHILAQIATAVCACGVSLFTIIESLTELCVPGEHKHHHHHHSEGDEQHAGPAVSPWPWVAALASMLVALCAWAFAPPVSEWPKAPPAHWWVSRGAALLVCAWLGPAPYGPGAPLEGSQLHDHVRDMAEVPLLPLLIALLVRRIDASSALFFCALVFVRAWAEGEPPARLLLQQTPPHKRAELDWRLSKACASADVIDVRDIFFWAVDEEMTVGSLIVVVRAGADRNAVIDHFQRTFAGALAEFTVQVDVEGDDDGWASDDYEPAGT